MAGFLDTMSNIWESTQDAWGVARNTFNNWQNSWGGAGNTTNALVSGALAAMGNLADTFTAKRVLALYERQEKEYIRNAEVQIDRLKLKGEIALRNMYVEHIKSQGVNELAVAASGAGGYSGSMLDKLVENKKYNTMDERTQQLQNLYDIDNVRRQGYISAISAAGQALTYANKNRGNAWNTFSSMFKTISAGINADIRTQQQIDAMNRMQQAADDYRSDVIDYTYGMQNSGLRDFGLGSGITSDSLLKINDVFNPTNIDSPASGSLLNTGDTYYG